MGHSTVRPRLDSNQRPRPSEGRALPLRYEGRWRGPVTGRVPRGGLEPPTSALSRRRSPAELPGRERGPDSNRRSRAYETRGNGRASPPRSAPRRDRTPHGLVEQVALSRRVESNHLPSPYQSDALTTRATTGWSSETWPEGHARTRNRSRTCNTPVLSRRPLPFGLPGQGARHGRTRWSMSGVTRSRTAHAELARQRCAPAPTPSTDVDVPSARVERARDRHLGTVPLPVGLRGRGGRRPVCAGRVISARATPTTGSPARSSTACPLRRGCGRPCAGCSHHRPLRC